MNDLVYINATFEWCYVTTPHPVNGKYSVDLCHLSDKAVEILEENGVNVRESEEKGRFVQSSSQYPLKFIRGVDENEDGTWPIIGSGSTGRVGLAFYETTYMKKRYKKVSVRRMSVSKFVPYERGPDPMDSDEEGALSYDQDSEV